MWLLRGTGNLPAGMLEVDVTREVTVYFRWEQPQVVIPPVIMFQRMLPKFCNKKLLMKIIAIKTMVTKCLHLLERVKGVITKTTKVQIRILKVANRMAILHQRVVLAGVLP
jgi:hypothetical protein